MSLDKILFFPYYFTLYCRNLLYDKGIWKSIHYTIPSICVGNIAAGGTGKTPMVELLIRIYGQEEKITVISRGYKRRTKGFRRVETNDDYRDVGDEPLQIKRKFPAVDVVVDSSRMRAFEILSALPENQKPTLVILDDAFQHRKIQPDYSILLTSFLNPLYSDSLLPAGHLRDLKSQTKRADMIVVTQVSEEITDEIRSFWRKKLKLRKEIPLLFSRVAYSDPLPVFPNDCNLRYSYAKSAIVFSGIANDARIKRDIYSKYALKVSLKFRDHHQFTKSDIASIVAQVRKYPTSVVITTEKDSQRLRFVEEMPVILKERLFYLPIETEIIPEVDSSKYLQEELPSIGMKQIKKLIIFKK